MEFAEYKPVFSYLPEDVQPEDVVCFINDIRVTNDIKFVYPEDGDSIYIVSAPGIPWLAIQIGLVIFSIAAAGYGAYQARKLRSALKKSKEERENAGFEGIITTAEVGDNIPAVYGEILVGGNIISGRVDSPALDIIGLLNTSVSDTVLWVDTVASDVSLTKSNTTTQFIPWLSTKYDIYIYISGKLVTFTSGANSGETRTIVGRTGHWGEGFIYSVLILDQALPNIPQAGDDFNIANVDVLKGALSSSQTLNAIVALSEGEINGPVKLGETGVVASTDDTPFMTINTNQITNLSTVDWNYKNGTNNQTVLFNDPSFKGSQTTVPKGTLLNDTTAKIITTTQDVYEADVVIKAVGTSGQGLNFRDDKGGRHPVSIQIDFRYKASSSGTWISLPSVQLSDNTNNPHTFRIRFKFPSQDIYDIELTRLIASTGLDTYADELTILEVVETTDVDVHVYPNTALVGIRVRGATEISGGVPQILTQIQGLKVRAYNGSSWDAAAYSNNPAWVIVDILTNDRFGLGAYHELSDLDATSFKTMSDYFDEMVDDGAGGTIKRSTFNGEITGKKSAWETCIQILAARNCALIKRGNQIIAKIEKTGTPSQLFTMSNIVADSFEQSYISASQVANSIEIRFRNEDNNFEVDISGYDFAGTGGVRKEIVDALGVTRRAEAVRLAKRIVDKNINEVRRIKFKADIDSIAVEPYDIFNFQHDVPAWGEGGRVISATSTTITLDKEVTIDGVSSYQVIVRKGGDDTLQTQAISSMSAGSYATLDVASWPSFTPSENDMYAFGTTTTTVKPFRCIEITRDNDQIREITGVEYNATIFDDSIPTLPTPNYSTLVDPNILPVPVTELIIRERFHFGEGEMLHSIVDIDFIESTSKYAAVYEVYMLEEGETIWGQVYIGNASHVEIDFHTELKGTDPIFSVVPVSVTGVRADPHQGTIEHVRNTLGEITGVLGYSTPPPDTENFLVERLADGTRRYSWGYPTPPLDLKGFHLRYYVGTGGSWETATVLHEGVITDNPYESNDLAAGTYEIYLKAINTTDIESVTASMVQVTLGDPRLRNVLVSQQANPDWAGTYSSAQIDGQGCLEPLGTGTWTSSPSTWDAWTSWIEGTYSPLVYTDVVIDLSGAITFTPLVTATTDSTQSLESRTAPGDLTGISITSGTGATVTVTATAHGYSNSDTVQIADSDATPDVLDGQFVISNVTANTFDITPSDTLTVGATTGTVVKWGTWVSIPTVITDKQYVQIRATISSTASEVPVLCALLTLIDADVFIEDAQVTDTTTAGGEITYTYINTFVAVTSTQIIAIQGAGVSLTWEVTSSDLMSATFKFYDTTDSSVYASTSITVDISIKGTR